MKRIKRTVDVLFQYAAVTALLLLLGGIARAQILPKQMGPTADYGGTMVLLRDTLYVLDSVFVEVDLRQQAAYLHTRSGSISRYPISTGNSALWRGIATREGIFTIKYRQRRHVSSIFNVMMYYWMPFNGGIGFHALTGDNYYQYLGVEPSSHGCVRMAREDAEMLFSSVRRGTPVFVHSGAPARVLQFGDTTILPELKVMDPIDVSLLRRRLEAVEQGRWLAPVLVQPLALPPGKAFRERIYVGHLRVPVDESAVAALPR